MTRVLIVQPYIPQYRVPFFQGLSPALADRGIELTIAAGRPGGGQAERRDAADIPGLIRLAEHRLGNRQRCLVVRDVRNVVGHADLIVMEQARRNLEAYPLLYWRSPAPVALWGHGKTTTRTTSSWEHRWLDSMTKRADWFFAYTEGGRRYMADHGFPSERISVVHNASDTVRLSHDRREVTASQRRSLLRKLRLTEGRTALSLGALDHSKRIGFMLSAAKVLATEVPGFTLVVAGDGPWRSSIERVADSESWLRYVGPVFGTDKALIASVADVMLNPGRVGLSVVDSFALGLPMVTTQWSGHAPEFEYLEDGVNGIVTHNSMSEFVAAVERLLSDQATRTDLTRGCSESAERHRLEVMVDRFAAGVQSALEAGVRRQHALRKRGTSEAHGLTRQLQQATASVTGRVS